MSEEPITDISMQDAASEGAGEQPAPERDAGVQVAVDLEELTSRAAQRDEYLALAQRTHADFENYRKRVVRDAANAETRGLIRVARELLPALDNLDRALAALEIADETVAEGMKLVRQELLGGLARVGIEPYSPVGEQFDPEFHDAVAQQPFEDAEPGTIVEVYQSGYRLAGTVIRAARVLVAGERP